MPERLSGFNLLTGTWVASTKSSRNPKAPATKVKDTLDSMGIVEAVLLLSLSVNGSPRHGAGPDTPEPAGKLFDIGGYRLHLHRSGQGDPPVVLIAGSGDFSFDWSLVQPGVARFSSVCSYDRAGQAWSDPGPTPRTMKQEAFELRALLRAAKVRGPYVLVGHSYGGLLARVYAERYPRDVGAVVLVDPTHEDTTLMIQGKLVRVRDRAQPTAIPPVQTMRSSPPKPPTQEDIEQFEFNVKTFGPPKIEAPFDKLPALAQAARLYFLSQPPRAASAPDFWAEELQAMHVARAKRPFPLGDIPLTVIVPKPEIGEPPPGIAAEEWKRVNEEKRKQKADLKNLSRRGKLLVAKKSGHHVQLDEPDVVIGAIRSMVDALRRRPKRTL